MKDVLMLNGRLVAVNRFIRRSTDKYKLFLKALKKNGADFCWNDKCETAFHELKKYLVSPPYHRKLPQERRCISTSLSQSQH